MELSVQLEVLSVSLYNIYSVRIMLFIIHVEKANQIRSRSDHFFGSYGEV